MLLTRAQPFFFSWWPCGESWILNLVGLGLLTALVRALSGLRECCFLDEGSWNENESQTTLVAAVILRHWEATQTLKLWAC